MTSETDVIFKPVGAAVTQGDAPHTLSKLAACLGWAAEGVQTEVSERRQGRQVWGRSAKPQVAVLYNSI